LDVIGVEVLELQPVLMEHERMNRPARTEKPRSWNTTKETTYPDSVWGIVSDSGIFQSSAAVGADSMPAAPSRWSIERETPEHVQFDIAARGCEV
jgi:hypothetical protein